MIKKIPYWILAGVLAASLLFPATSFAEGKKIKVAFALLWTIDDQGWTTGHYRGIQYLIEKMGDQVEIAYTEKVRAGICETLTRKQLAEALLSPRHAQEISAYHCSWCR